jgi:O-antigen biosynthesis protein WbqP
MKRFFDFTLALLLAGLLSIPMLLMAAAIRIGSKGPALYWSNRVGKENAVFKMPKFRTMHLNAPAVATHLLKNSDAFITPLGRHLRKLSIDELPQLISILKGDMSFVGPRPALFNQHDLIELRTRRGIHRIPPGMSGWAQINGRDELPVPAKVELDAFYLRHRSFGMDLRILALTVFRVIAGKAISH